MSTQLLVRQKDNATEIALIKDKQLTDFYVSQEGSILSEQVYLGKVDRVMKGMNAFFVKITKTACGFLPFNEVKTPLKQGDKVLVQVKKPPVQSKSAYLTTDISLAGEYAILLPFSPLVSLSAKITDENTRNALLSLANTLRVEKRGLVLRTNSVGVNENVIAQEISALNASCDALLEQAKTYTPPCLLQNTDSLSKVLRDTKNVDKIVLQAPHPLYPNAQIVDNPFALFSVTDQLKKAFSRHIYLKSGGAVVVDICEAMTVIDVNTEKYTGKKSGAEDTFLALNLEAAKLIARIMRLRNLGGIILVDFIDMKEQAHKDTLLQYLKECVQDDPVKCVIVGYTALNLMEITRKKTTDQISPSYIKNLQD